MKKLMIAFLLLMTLVTGCSSSNKYGKCVGLNGKEDPKLQYEYNAWNMALGFIFLETLVVPLVVVLDDLKCPVGSN